MIFQHTWEKVLSGEKTQSRRIVKPEHQVGLTDGWGGPILCVTTGKVFHQKIVYGVGKDYAVQPGRTQKAIARIRITDIRHEDVRRISEEDAKAEGFTHPVEFLRVWSRMHDPTFMLWFDERVHSFLWYAGSIRKDPVIGCGDWSDFQKAIASRSAERYDAWALTFELVRAKP